MEFRQLEIFLMVARCQSFSAAAEKLHLSQSTVSSQVLALEEELGTRLIDRSTRSFVLSAAGMKLCAHAQDLLRLRDRAQMDLSGLRKTQLEIGASSVPALCIVPELICAFHRLHPETRFNVVEDDSGRIIDQVAGGTLDVGFVGTNTQNPACNFLPLMEDELVVLAPDRPPYDAWPAASMRELLHQPFLMRGQASGTKAETLRILGQMGIQEQELNIIAHISDAQLICRCVAEGLGISILSRRYAMAQQGSMRTLPLAGIDASRRLYLVHRKEKHPPELIRRFVHLARQLHAD